MRRYRYRPARHNNRLSVMPGHDGTESFWGPSASRARRA
jgi:hypothetical protein